MRFIATIACQAKSHNTHPGLHATLIDDEILAEKHRRSNPFPPLMIALTALVACVITAGGTIPLATIA